MQNQDVLPSASGGRGRSRAAPSRGGAVLTLAAAVLLLVATIAWRDRMFDLDLPSLLSIYGPLLAGFAATAVVSASALWRSRTDPLVRRLLVGLPALALAALASVGFYNNASEYQDLRGLRERIAQEEAAPPSPPQPTFSAAPVPVSGAFSDPSMMLTAIVDAGFGCDAYGEAPSADNTGAISLFCVLDGETVFLSVYPTPAVQAENSFGESAIRQGEGWGVEADSPETADALFAVLQAAATTP